MSSPIRSDFHHLFLKLEKIKEINDQSIASFQGGRLKFFQQFWKTITYDKWVLNAISGITIPCAGPLPDKQPHQINFNNEEKIQIQKEIDEMLVKKIIEPVKTSTDDEFVSPIFSRPKKSGNVRIILNLKEFNKSVEKKHFKMQTLNSAIQLMKKDAFMASIDFKDAYYSVPIKQSHQKYLRFYWNGVKYQYVCLPNGLSNGPRDFTKLCKTLLRFIRKQGYTLTNYIDDNFSIESDFRTCLENVIETASVSIRAGFVINWEKSVLVPTQILVYLGFILNTMEMTVRLTPEKVQELKRLVKQANDFKEISLEKLAQLVGKLVASFPGVTYGKLFYRQLDIEKNNGLKIHKGNYKKTITLSQKSKEDLHWWMLNLDSECVYVKEKIPDLEVTCDASNSGWGGWIGNKSTKGHWSLTEKDMHINQKELYAVLFTLQSICEDVSNKTVKVSSDNTVTVAYINNMGGKIQSCFKVARKIWDWARQRNIWLIAVHIPGKTNIEADQLSRSLTVNTEWSLSDSIFGKIKSHYAWLKFDLFASRMNNKFDDYASWLPDPGAKLCNAFSFRWNNLGGYAFPPFTLVGRVLKKVQEENSKIVIVVPDWPTSFWYSRLLQMATDIPFYISGTTILTNPIDQGEPLKAGLIVCCIEALQDTDSKLGSRTLSITHGETVRKNSTELIFKNGKDFVKQKDKICFRHL